MCWRQVLEEFTGLLTAMAPALTESWGVDIFPTVRILAGLSDSAPGVFRQSSVCCRGLVHLVQKYLEHAKLRARSAPAELQHGAIILHELAMRLLPAALHTAPLQTKQDLAESACLAVQALLASVDKLDRAAEKTARVVSYSQEWKRHAEPMLAASLHVLRCAPPTRHDLAAMRCCIRALCCCL